MLVTPNIKKWNDEKKRIEESEDNRLYIGGRYTLRLALLCSNTDPKYFEIDMNVLSAGKNDPKTDQMLGSINLLKRISFAFKGELLTDKAFEY